MILVSLSKIKGHMKDAELRRTCEKVSDVSAF